ncbi:cathepsin L1-like [Colossoma macropomum]|uniref:cathepsin L1-like n=1 Tax=Colossoma macropomum TaxID=42526 RepID=UPI001863A1AF|nr:cathepsin L1-like [Colossoma macropomum]
MRVLLAVAALVVAAGAASVSMEDLEFHVWKQKFGKHYGSVDEESRRKMTWLDSRKQVLVHNLLADQGIKSYRLGMTRFADMDNQEYQATFTHCLRSSNRTQSRSTPTLLRHAEGVTLPNTVDWTDMGFVTEVRDQEVCGSCWTFSAVGALEGQMFRKTGKLVPLSEQQLLDCSWPFGNDGCEGGFVDRAFRYIMESGGLMSESSYPYENKEGMCRFKPMEASATCSGFEQLPVGDENALQMAVAAIGPISVGIEASRSTLRLYESGVYDDPYCTDENLNHAVLVVGYGTDEHGHDYWLVKNSWGAKWGEKGYIRMSRNKRNQCGIASDAVYPVV